MDTDDLLPLSALQHLLFCERQCALIHVERMWSENRLTAEGQLLHRRANEGADDWRGTTRVVRGLPLCSYALGLIGKGDVVEFEPLADPAHAAARAPVAQLAECIQAAPHAWRVMPVEYKRGQPKSDDSDRVQLAAQALCLEEMLGVSIACGELFYGRRRRRTEVPFDAALRALTIRSAQRLHEMIAARHTPPAERAPKCDNCSLFDLCLPQAVERGRRVAAFVERQFAGVLDATGPASDPFA